MISNCIAECIVENILLNTKLRAGIRCSLKEQSCCRPIVIPFVGKDEHMKRKIVFVCVLISFLWSQPGHSQDLIVDTRHDPSPNGTINLTLTVPINFSDVHPHADRLGVTCVLRNSANSRLVGSDWVAVDLSSLTTAPDGYRDVNQDLEIQFALTPAQLQQAARYGCEFSLCPNSDLTGTDRCKVVGTDAGYYSDGSEDEPYWARGVSSGRGIGGNVIHPEP